MFIQKKSSDDSPVQTDHRYSDLMGSSTQYNDTIQPLHRLRSLSEYIPRSTKLQTMYEKYAETSANALSFQKKLMYSLLILLWITFYVFSFIHIDVLFIRHCLIVIALSTILLFTISPLYIPISIKNVNISIPLDMSTVSVLSILVLLSTGKFPFHSVVSAIVGDQIHPWQVLGILFGLCYLCITLDKTGILKALSIYLTAKSNGSALRLFTFVFAIVSALTVFTNNDISIICLTPLVISIANNAKIDSEPFIFLVLFSANTWSMLLQPGNPANMIISESANLSFIDYSWYMAAPTVITAIVLYIECYVMFRKQLSEMKIEIEKLDKFDDKGEQENAWKSLIKYKKYSVFCAVRLLCAVVGLASTSMPYLNRIDYFDLYIVLSIAIISFVSDSVILHRKHVDYNEQVDEYQLPMIQNIMQIDAYNHQINENNGDDDDENDGEHGNRSFAMNAFLEVPWKLIPFVLSLFVLVQFMDDLDFIDWLAKSMVNLQLKTSEWVAPVTIAFVSCFGCQLINNQPMTVLIATVLSNLDDKYVVMVDTLKGTRFALAIGVNLGGNGTPIASLAVLMWRQILLKHGLYVDYFRFSKRGLVITPLLVLICVSIMCAEI